MNKLIITTSNLKPALSKLSQAIHARPLLPVLANIYCKVDVDKVELIGSDTEITIFYQCECISKESFEFLLPFEFINKIVAINKDAPLEIEVGKSVKIKCNNDVYEIKPSSKVADFPKLPEVKIENIVKLNKDILNCIITAVATTGNAKPQFTCVLLELDKDLITVASTDGMQMVFSQEFERESQIKQEILLSQKVIKSLTGVDDLIIWYSEKMIALDCGNFRVINTRGEEKFANYRKIFPAFYESNLSVHKFSLIDALNKCSLVNDQFKVAKVELSANEIRLLASDDMVNINVPIEAKYTGTVAATAFNFEKLLKLLSQVECIDIQFTIDDVSRAFVITSTELKGYKGLIMPLNITKKSN